MNEKHPREEAIFEGALQLSPEQREAYLQAACGDDVTLLERIRDLIRFHEKSDGPLETPAVASPPKATIVPSLPAGEKPGDKIGNYKILQLIGEGGCGFEVVVIIAIAESLAQDVEVDEHDKEKACHEKGVAYIDLVIGKHVKQHAQQEPGQ